MLETKVCGIRLENPTILASGILGNMGSSLKKVARGGAGAVVTKSIGKDERKGYKNPTVIRIEQGYLNAIGLANQGINEFEEEVAIAKEGGVPVIGSVFGFSVRDFVSVAKKMDEYGVDALELNLSCPNVGKAGSFFSSTEELTYDVVKAVKDNTGVPVIAKLTANTGDIVSIAKACERAGCDAVTAINTLKAMKIDLKTGVPILGNTLGGMSGPCIKPVGVACVYEIVKETSLPVIGCGGVATGDDAVEYLMAGAKAVQIGVGVADRGINVFRKVAREIEDFMNEHGYNNLKDLIGVAQR